MWVYDSSRAIVAAISLSFLRKIGPCEGSRYSTSESRIRFRLATKSTRFEPWWASITPTQPSRKMLSPEKSRLPIRNASWPAVWPGVLQTSSVLSPIFRRSPSSITRSTLQRRHRDVDALGVDPGVGEDLVAFLDRRDALGVGGHLALEDLAGPRQPLGVVDVGVGRDDQLAGGEAEIHLADQLEHVGQLVEEPDVDQGEFRAAVDQVDVHPHPALRLVVHLDHAREDVTPLDHSKTSSRERM